MNNGDGAWLAIGDWSPNQTSQITTDTTTVSNVTIVNGQGPSLTTENIKCDDITGWNNGTMFSASISQGELTLTAGIEPTLNYSEKTIGSVNNWDAGSVTTVTDNPKTVVTSVSVVE